jgi:hypothetical protein
MAMVVNLIGKNPKFRAGRRDRLSYGVVQNSTLSTLDQNDTISIVTLTNSRILLGSGNDILNVTGSADKATVNLGSGNNSASFANILSSTVNGSSGVDIISVNYAEKSSFLLGAGNDTFKLSGTMNSSGYGNTIEGQGGSDTIELIQFSAKVDLSYSQGYFVIYDFGQTKFRGIEKLVLANGITANLADGPQGSDQGLITVNGTSGNDLLQARSNSAMLYSVNAGDGDDTISVSPFNATTIDGGAGTDGIILEEERTITLNGGKWSIGTGQNVVSIQNIETIFLPNSSSLYTLRSNGAKITSSSALGIAFKGTTGTDTIVGTARDDSFINYGDKFGDFSADFFDLSAGGNDTIAFNPRSYGAGTTTLFKLGSVFGADKNDKFGSIFSETIKIVTDTRRYTGAIATSGYVRLQANSAPGLTFQVDFIGTKPT